MCYPCTHCNKCGKYPKPGTCYVCGHVNELGVPACVKCGNPFPLPPGKQMSIETEEAGDTQQEIEEARGEGEQPE